MNFICNKFRKNTLRLQTWNTLFNAFTGEFYGKFYEMFKNLEARAIIIDWLGQNFPEDDSSVKRQMCQRRSMEIN